jgi:hypothetical protein
MSSQVPRLDVDDNPRTSNKRLAFIDHIPTFRQYIQDTWFDLLAIICVGALVILVSSTSYLLKLTHNY